MGKGRLWVLAFSAALVAAFTNPFAERLEYSNPTLFMLSHYALFLAGLLAGPTLFRLGRPLWPVGVFFAVFWHVPQAFALSAALAAYRVLEEFTMFLGGLLVGLNVHAMGDRTKLALIALWVVGDTLLSVLFIARPQLYADAPHSPYTSSGFLAAGVSMAILANAFIGYLLYNYVRKVGGLLAEKEKGSA